MRQRKDVEENIRQQLVELGAIELDAFDKKRARLNALDALRDEMDEIVRFELALERDTANMQRDEYRRKLKDREEADAEAAADEARAAKESDKVGL